MYKADERHGRHKVYNSRIDDFFFKKAPFFKTRLQNAKKKNHKHFIWHIKYKDNSENKTKQNFMSLLLTLLLLLFLVSEDVLISFKKNGGVLSTARGSKHRRSSKQTHTHRKNFLKIKDDI